MVQIKLFCYVERSEISKNNTKRDTLASIRSLSMTNKILDIYNMTE